jgi:hypothetical protein
MPINNRAEFISAASSEKITLAQINAKKRLYVFSGPTLDIYSKVVPHFVVGLKQDDTDLSPVANLASVVEGTFFYDIEESTLYTRLIGSVAPDSVELIVTYKFFYSDKGLSLPHDLQDISEDVNYEGRIVSSPGYKHKIGIEQALSSLVGEGTLHLKNQDGGLDETFDTMIFENQDVIIYSWNPLLQPSESRVIYRGRVTNKVFDGTDVKFKIKDQIFALLDSPSLDAYGATDNVSESVKGQYKRRVYGRVDGLRGQSIDQIADGISLTGTVAAVPNSTVLTGTGTLFLTETQQGDTITVGLQEFDIESVDSDTSITLSDETEYGFSGQPSTLVPARGTNARNRDFLCAGHICAEVTHTITNVPQFNRVVLDDTQGLFAGDFIEFNDTSERLEIENVAPGNIVVLRQNMVLKPSVSTTITRRPIQEVYVRSRRVNADDFSIFNTGGECGIILDADVEFNLARSKNTVFSGTFTNGSRVVTVSTSEVALDEVFQPGDWVKPDSVTYTTFYKIVNIDADANTLELSVSFTDATTTDTIEYKSPDYIEDDTPVSVNILGRTVDGTATGTWITTVSQASKDLLVDIDITTVNDQSFTDGFNDGNQLISMAIPIDFNTKTLPTVKDITDKLNKSINSSLTLDNNLLIKFQVLNVFAGVDLTTISDNDVIQWKIKSTNGKTFKKVNSRYRFSDVQLSNLEPGNQLFTFESVFVDRYIGTNKVDELNLYLYKDLDAKIASRRFIYYNRLGRATLSITTDLRLENVEIGQVVIADFQRLYKRFGDSTSRKKLMLVIGKTLTGERTQLELSDLGNTFNTSSYITENTAPDYVTATEDEKLINGYITDNQGIVNNEEDTAGVHLIS